MNIRRLSYLLIGGVFAFVMVYASALLYFTWPISEFSIASSGVFGDSFGLLTSLFSGLAFAGLIITLLVQREELKLNWRALNEQIAEMKVQNQSLVMQKEELGMQREELQYTREELKGQKEEMRKQNAALQIQQFENTFFKMLELLETCRRDIGYGRGNHEKGGREALCVRFINEYLKEFPGKNYGLTGKHKVLPDRHKKLNGIGLAYNKFYTEYCDDLGQYYRII